MKIDTHQHFWHYNDRDYGWMGPGMESLKCDRLPADLAGLLEKNGIGGTIAVQARQCLEETQWLLNTVGLTFEFFVPLFLFSFFFFSILLFISFSEKGENYPAYSI